jgi:CDP-glycerol glycerophosphotransferase
VSEAPTVVFASWSSRYSDNPRAISEELARRGAPIEHAFLLADDAGPVPDHVRRIRPGGPEALEALSSAPYLVSNDVLSDDFTKAPGARYLQTWHGTPLKRIAHDVESRTFFKAEEYATWLPRDVARWDVLLSPNRYSTEVMRRAFRYEGEVLETGYPRNDVLSAPDRDAVRARVREHLELEDGQTAVLYAPTWRDSLDFTFELDLDALTRGLGDDVVVLVRAHWLVSATAQVAATPGTRLVSDYQDIRDLYLAADALVTDYSSTMFDFAVTGKPVLFYVYDLASYRDELRGFYFDLAAEAPGPLLETTEDVVGALRDLDAVAARHAEAYARFRERFCHLEDGRAAARVVDALFGDL